MPTDIRICEPKTLATSDRVAQPRLVSICWDAYTGHAFAVVGRAMVRLSEQGEATVVAGHPTEAGRLDGSGLSARFTCCNEILSDGQGCLYVIDQHELRRLQLPSTLGPSPSGAAGTAARASPGGEVRVTTVGCGHLDGRLRRGAYDAASRCLVLCTRTAVCRLPVAGLGAAAPGALHKTVLVAGKRGSAGSGFKDGVGKAARFRCIRSVAVDNSGTAWILDRDRELSGYGSDSEEEEKLLGSIYGSHLRRVDPSGAVTTVWDAGRCTCAAVLRNGCLALLQPGDKEMRLVQLGLADSWGGPRPRSIVPGTLSSDLGELLDRQPDGSADVEVEVGRQVFAAHRSVLAARSPYFRQRLDPGAGFADGRAPRLSLPDADPAAFGAVLRFMYTDSAGPVPPELLQPVGELADRLLLPGLCAQVGSQLLGRVCAESVVGLLLWAEQRSGSFGALLGGLKEWVLQHNEPEAGRLLPDEDVLRLMRESPELALQLLQHRRADGEGDTKRRRKE